MSAENIAAVFAEGSDKILHGRRSLGEARGISAESLEGVYSVAHEFYRQGKYDEALKAFELLCLYDHEQPRWWQGLGYCRQVLKDYEGAATALSYAALYSDAHDYEMYLHLAECLVALERAEDAEEPLDEILRSAADEGIKEKAKVLKNQLG